MIFIFFIVAHFSHVLHEHLLSYPSNHPIIHEISLNPFHAFKSFIFFPIFGGFPHIEAGPQTIFCSKRILEACF